MKETSGVDGLALPLIESLAVCLLEIAEFEVDAWVIKSLTLGICITIKKTTLRIYTTG